jgi:CheY-like chemotaxis protein
MAVDPPTARVLLVDDKPQNLLALEAILSNLHLEVVKARSGGHPVLIRHPQRREQVLHLPLIHRLAPLRSLSSMHEATRPGQRGLTGL